MKKHKIDAYLGVFRENLRKLCKKIKKARKEGKIDKEHTKRLIEEAKRLRDLLKDVE